MSNHAATRRGCLLATATILVVSSLSVGQDSAPKTAAWTPEKCFKIKNVGNVQPSPDGKRVLYTITEAVFTADSASDRTQLFVADADADGAGATPLTKGESQPSSPQWSPDGAWIAYLSKNKLYRIRPDGADAEALTEDRVVISFKWSPDGAALAFTEAPPESKKSKGPGLVVDQDIFLGPGRPHNPVCVVAAAKDADGKYHVRRLTGADYHAISFDWSPDGKDIAFTGVNWKGQPPNRSPDPAGPRNSMSADLWLVNVAAGKVRSLLQSGAAIRDPHFSPDGQWIACTVSDVPPTWTGGLRVHLIPRNGGAPKLLAPTLDESPALAGWSADGSRIYFVESHRTALRLCALPLDGNPVALSADHRIVGVKDAVSGGVFVNAGRTVVGFPMQSLDRPPEAFVSKIDDFEPVQITKINDDLRKLPVTRTESIHWKSKDGSEIEGLLTYPHGYAAGKRYPLLLFIHGGPNAVYAQTFIAHPKTEPIAVFAERGFAVLRPNPRGSSGYGTKFRQANHRDWGGRDYDDVMAGVDHVIALGVADEKKLGVLGYSYGGFLTAWTIARTDRFRAASIGASLTNLASFAGTTAVVSILPSYYGLNFWDDRDLLEKHSPLLHLKNVTTPTFIYHGDKDVIAPIGQGYELYNALKRQGCPTEMVVYPSATHNPGAYRTLDIMRRNVAWMEKYAK
jgi:dipeptidyl aminopeptidase/acylaminoacyl peptidase